MNVNTCLIFVVSNSTEILDIRLKLVMKLFGWKNKTYIFVIIVI